MTRARHRPVALRSERGSVLVVVLTILAFISVLSLSLLSLAQTHLRSGVAFQSRTDRVAAHSDAVQYAINAIRGTHSVGTAGTSSTWKYGSITVTCTGDAGSGTAQGYGTTDRTVTCSTSVIKAQVRYFDRGGAADGVVCELLSWKLL